MSVNTTAVLIQSWRQRLPILGICLELTFYSVSLAVSFTWVLDHQTTAKAGISRKSSQGENVPEFVLIRKQPPRSVSRAYSFLIEITRLERSSRQSKSLMRLRQAGCGIS